MTGTRADANKVIADLAYASEALAEIRETALRLLPQVSQSRFLHDPLLDIVNAAGRGLRLPKEEPCSTTTR